MGNNCQFTVFDKKGVFGISVTMGHDTLRYDSGLILCLAIQDPEFDSSRRIVGRQACYLSLQKKPTETWI